MRNIKSKFMIISLIGVSLKCKFSLVGISINFWNNKEQKEIENTKVISLNNDILTQKIYDNLVDVNHKNIGKVPKENVTTEMCNHIIDTNPNNFNLIPPEHITDELCERLLNKSIMFYSLIPEEKRTKKIRDKVIKYHEKELEENYSNIYCVPNELVDDKMFTLAFMKSKGNISHEYINKYNISLSTQNKLNNYCYENHQQYYPNGYCGIVLKSKIE